MSLEKGHSIFQGLENGALPILFLCLGLCNGPVPEKQIKKKGIKGYSFQLSKQPGISYFVTLFNSEKLSMPCMNSFHLFTVFPLL